ncbi:hypothetical protein GGR55DRAFT_684261 [Xylaria sp. FL0064]|nr:hypothetical protein GGR55DRAFT_684261 [Xylaria sp. FL0064]
MAVILITGANRGIGFAIAEAISVLIGCRDTNAGDDAIKCLKTNGITNTLHSIPLDIESDASIATAAKIIGEKFGKLDVLINNAIKLDISNLSELEELRKTSNANFNNAVNL